MKEYNISIFFAEITYVKDRPGNNCILHIPKTNIRYCVSCPLLESSVMKGDLLHFETYFYIICEKLSFEMVHVTGSN
jgi:hypothetical protein